MNKKTRITTLVIAIALLAPVLVLASGGKESAQPAAAAQKAVTFQWWNIGTAANDTVMNQGFVDAFMKANPNVKIENVVMENEAFKTKLTTVMQSGNPPDLFQTWGGGVLAQYANGNLLRDITSFVKGSDWYATQSPAVWGVYSADGKIYAAATDMGCVTFWYNKELLAKVGYTSFPTDQDDFIALVKKLKAAGITPIAVAGGDKWPAMYYWSYIALRIGGGQLFSDVLSGKNPKGFEDPVFVQAGQTLKDLAALNPFQEGFLGATYGDQATLVGNGQAAMELMGQWAPNVEKDNSTSKQGLGDKLGCAAFPAIKGGKGKVSDVMGGGGGYAVGKNAPDAAVAFLKFLTSKDNEITMAKTSGIIPPVVGTEVGVMDPNAKLVKALVDKSTFYQLYLDQFLPPAGGQMLNDQVQAILAGTSTPAQACAKIQAAFLNK